MKQTQTIPHTGVPTAETTVQVLPSAVNERIINSVILLIALIQALFFITLAPPWQHYDEPTHFEYAWLIAHSDTLLPTVSDENLVLRREIAASMVEQRFFQFSSGVPKPNLSSGDEIWLGTSELGHPPAYYLLVSLPLRLVGHLDVVSQLYVARAVSIVLFLLTIVASIGCIRAITPADSPLRWAVPLALTLLPPFVDLMTSVNNDVGAVAIFSLFLWAAVRTLYYGLSWWRIAGLFATALLAVATKNTAAFALPLAPLVVIISFVMRFGWRWLLLAGLGLAVVGAIAIMTWGDPAYWYRSANLTSQATALRVTHPLAPFGTHAMMLELSSELSDGQAINPLLPQAAQSSAGATITLGGWIWSDTPNVDAAIGISYQTPDMAMAMPVNHPVAISGTPTFVSWTFQVPDHTYLLNYVVYASASNSTTPAHVFLDGALVAAGEFPTNTTPVFDNPTAQSGTWAGQPFTNLVRNPSGEQSWPRIRLWFDHMISQYTHRSAAQLIASLFDPQRLAPIVLPYLVKPAVDSTFQTFGWGNIRLADPIWQMLASYLGLCALLGILKWSFQPTRPRLQGTLLFVALIGLLIWGNTLLRPLPLLGSTYSVPAARYTFPAIIVTMLAIVGGWWALWPRRFQLYALFVLIGLFMLLNYTAMNTIISFYHPIPLS